MTDLPASDEPLAQPQPTPALGFSIGAIFVVALVVAILFGASASEQLLFGWLYFPLRVVDDVTVDWPSAILGCVCMLAFVLTLDRTVRWFARDSFRWSLQSTMATSLAVVLLFGAGIAMVGLTHQTIWLFTGRSREGKSPQPSVSGLLISLREDESEREVKYYLKSAGVGAWNFTDTTRGILPAGGVMESDGTLLHGWAIPLAPYFNYAFSYRGIDLKIPWNSPENAPYYKGAIPAFLHPSIEEVFDREGFAYSHIAANAHVFPIATETPGKEHWMQSGRRIRGLSNIILFGTVSSEFRPWGHPANVRDPSIGVNQSPIGFGGPSGDGANFVMGDGTVRFLSSKTDPEVLRQLSNPDVAN